VHFFIERSLRCSLRAAEPSQCGIADHRQEPGPPVSAPKTVEEPKGAQLGLPPDVLRIVLVPWEPTPQVKSRVQMRTHRFLGSQPGFDRPGPQSA
jgi:hypothetical protein